MEREKDFPHVTTTPPLSEKGIHETKIVARFWMVGILLAIISLATLKT